MRHVWLVSALAAQALAGEYALLDNGLRLYVDRHETVGSSVRLHLASGYSEVPTARVIAFEPEERVPLPPVPETKPLPSPQELITQAAAKHGLPAEFVHSVARAESAYRPDAVSPKGAIGLMQLMPATARELNADPHDPAQNAEAGARYLRELLIKYGYSVPRALAAYNAGPGAVDRYNGIPPYRETREYVNRVIKQYTHAQTSSIATNPSVR